MNDHVCEILFDDMGIPVDGKGAGLFSGTACIDENGKITGLHIDCYAGGKCRTHYFAVPSHRYEWINDMAEMIADRFKPEIREAVNAWHVEQAEASGFKGVRSDREEHGTYRGRP